MGSVFRRLLTAGLCLAPLPGLADALVEKGAYLSRITGCEGCHSPHDEQGKVAADRLMAGGDHPIRTGGGAVVPPNITPDKEAGIGAWDVAAIALAIRAGKTPDGRVLSAAMPWRTQFSALTEEDARAIAAYLLSLPARK
jgi:hypothetical protein